MRAGLCADKFASYRRLLAAMTAFHNQLRLAAPPEKVFALVLASLTKPLSKAGFKVHEQDPHHIIWTRDAGWGWGPWWGASSSQRITMSFVGVSDNTSTLLTIAGDAPIRIARELGRLTI
jgi:hypothetical protein